MAVNFYCIKCLTNLHVGNGDVNYNVVDNEVEKDPVTQYPVINSSGVKGAFREYFEKNAISYVEELFGTAVKKGEESSTPGKLKFLQASMLARPVRASLGKNAYYMVTTAKALAQFEAMLNSFGKTKNLDFGDFCEETDCRSCKERIALEGYEIKDELCEGSLKESIEELIGEDFVITSDSSFRKFPLPVIARNHLINGISDNLWYEEVVPHESLFWFAVIGDEAELEKFDSVVNGNVIQFGGNSTIGYGICLVKKMEE